MSDYNKIDVIAMRNAQYSGTSQANNIRPGAVTLFAEHRSASSVLGYWGGDAYPVSWSTEVDGKQLGLLIAADGVGNGNFVHQRLVNKLENEVGGTENDKLYYFLGALFGEEFFEDAEAMDYAVRCFSPIPPNCFFNTDMPIGTAPGGQINIPFYKKDSQYLSSRIIAIGVFYKFRRYFVDNEFSPAAVAELRRQIEYYIDGESDLDGNLIEGKKGELRQNIEKVFWYEEGEKVNGRPATCWQDAKRKDKYFLPCTLSCWFFVNPLGAPAIDAVACYVGDARAYKVDTVDGVMQISVDDAEPVTNTMDCCIRYGSNHAGGEHTSAHDCAIKATYTQIQKPCALFACSDGVYDTCMPNALGTHKVEMGIGGCALYENYEHSYDCCDLAFEYNYLRLLRRCHSLDDIVQFTARTIYLHADPDKVGVEGAVAVVSQGENPINVKRDDSATMAMMFFDNTEGAYPQLLDMLPDAKTTLDVAVEELRKNKGKETYCISYPNPDVCEEQKAAAANRYPDEFWANEQWNQTLAEWAKEDIDAASADADPSQEESFGIWRSADNVNGFDVNAETDAVAFVEANRPAILDKMLSEGAVWIDKLNSANNTENSKNEIGESVERTYQKVRELLMVIGKFAKYYLGMSTDYVELDAVKNSKERLVVEQLPAIKTLIGIYRESVDASLEVVAQWDRISNGIFELFNKKYQNGKEIFQQYLYAYLDIKKKEDARVAETATAGKKGKRAKEKTEDKLKLEELTLAILKKIVKFVDSLPEQLLTVEPVDNSKLSLSGGCKNYILHTYARYEAANRLIAAIVKDEGVNIDNLKDKMSQLNADAAREVVEAFEKVQKAFEAYDRLTTAKRVSYVVAADGAADYTQIMQATNRGV